MVVACRGDGVLVGVDGAEVISLREAAGTPEGGKVLGRGSAPMGAVLGIGPYDAERAAGVEFAQVYRCFVPLQETHNKAAGRACCSFARAAPREPSQGKGRSPRGH